MQTIMPWVKQCSSVVEHVYVHKNDKGDINFVHCQVGDCSPGISKALFSSCSKYIPTLSNLSVSVSPPKQKGYELIK